MSKWQSTIQTLQEEAPKHSPVSPSSLYRILVCPGSVNEVKLAPVEPPSEYAERGTLCHEAVPLVWFEKSIDHLGLDQNEENWVLDCIDYVNDIVKNYPAYEAAWEVQGTLAAYGLGDIWGTRDLEILGNNELHVIDWKFGKGHPVYVDDNPQLLAYLMMALADVVINSDVKLFIHLIQPPKNYYGVQEVSKEQLNNFTIKLIDVYEQTLKPDAPLVPGEEQCRFCPARNICRARYNYKLEQAHDVFDIIDKHGGIPAPHTVTTDELAEMFTKLQALEDYRSELGKHGLKELNAGRKFGNYKLVRGKSNRNWEDQKRMIRFMTKYYKGTNLYNPRTLLSPAQLEKSNRSLKKDKDFQQLIYKPEGKLKMADESDPRPAVTKTDKALDVFKEV